MHIALKSEVAWPNQLQRFPVAGSKLVQQDGNDAILSVVEDGRGVVDELLDARPAHSPAYHPIPVLQNTVLPLVFRRLAGLLQVHVENVQERQRRAVNGAVHSGMASVSRGTGRIHVPVSGSIPAMQRPPGHHEFAKQMSCMTAPIS